MNDVHLLIILAPFENVIQKLNFTEYSEISEQYVLKKYFNSLSSYTLTLLLVSASNLDDLRLNLPDSDMYKEPPVI